MYLQFKVKVKNKKYWLFILFLKGACFIYYLLARPPRRHAPPAMIGASSGVKALMQLLVRSVTDALLVPIPQYPLYR